MELEAQIRDYIAQNLLFSDTGFAYSDDASFLQEGLIDSLGVMDLVMYATSSFGISVDRREVTPQNFDSVNKLAGYIRRKKKIAE